MNRLQNETSLYLLQHAANPVDWYPWGDEAFEKAKAENKPVLISIGYAACHWCHVMEHESFEDATVAAYMNEYFVCIKVDREEHPAVDHFYMDALQTIAGQGGWPLNMFTTPDRKPFYGGTYFPPKSLPYRQSWMDVLHAVNNLWNDKKEDIFLQSQQIVKHLQNASDTTFSTSTISKENMDVCAERLLKHADKEYGGFGAAPKFPASMSIRFLLEHYYFTKNEASLQQALLSLDKMIAGGIYDQLGGGFARYSTDRYWLAPHFEKMLYDNALLLTALSDAYRITKNETYKTVIEETIAFCNNELKGEEGLYFSALDADSEGEEGKYYTYTSDEWNDALQESHPAVAAYFGIKEEGNWEGTNILHQAKTTCDILNEFSLQEEEWNGIVKNHKQKLLDARAKRVRPATDDKAILSWNALMNSALVKASIALQREDWLQQAQQHIDLVLQTFLKDNGVNRIYKNNVGRIEATLEDYAYLIAALIDIGSVTGKEKYLHHAQNLLQETIKLFSDDKDCFFYFSSIQQDDIVVRKIETYDGAMPSANAVMMYNLYYLGNLFEESNWIERSMKMMINMNTTATSYPMSFSYWDIFIQRFVNGFKQLVIAGADAASQTIKCSSMFQPSLWIVATNMEETTIPSFKNKYRNDECLYYLCSDFACMLPLNNFENILKQIRVDTIG